MTYGPIDQILADHLGPVLHSSGSGSASGNRAPGQVAKVAAFRHGVRTIVNATDDVVEVIDVQ